MAIAAIALSALGVIALAAGDWSLVFTKSWVYLWFGYCAWLLFWNPSIRISSDVVVIDNVFRIFQLNWSSINRIDTKYSLTLETNFGVIRAFGAPAPSRYAGFMASRTDAAHLPESSFIGKGLVRPGDLTSSDSGVAAYLIRSHWEILRDRNELINKPKVETRWVAWRVIVFATLSVATILSFIL
jgi:hypothetical protein